MKEEFNDISRARLKSENIMWNAKEDGLTWQRIELPPTIMKMCSEEKIQILIGNWKSYWSDIIAIIDGSLKMQKKPLDGGRKVLLNN